MIIKTSIIKKLSSGEYRLYSRKKDQSGIRRRLGTHDSLLDAKAHEEQIQYFKHYSLEVVADDKQTKMLGELSEIATYLEEAGYIEKSSLCYDLMSAIDGSMAADDDDDDEKKKKKKKKMYLPVKDTAKVDPRDYKYRGDIESKRFVYTLEKGNEVDVRDQLHPYQAKEIIRNIAKKGRVESHNPHLFDRLIQREISIKVISTALTLGSTTEPEIEGGSWRYKILTPLSGGIILVVKIKNNNTVTVITAWESQMRKNMRRLGKRAREQAWEREE